MARYIPIGSPVNPSEEDGIRALRDKLPDGYVVIGNFELQLPRRKNTLEYDALVVGDHGIYAVEIKGWGGRIEGDIRKWRLDWKRVENPLIHIESKAKALRHELSTRLGDEWPSRLCCESVVLLTRSNVELVLHDERRERVITTDQVQDFFVDRARRVEPGESLLVLDDRLRQRIVDVLVPMAHPNLQLVTVPGYEIEEELERPLSGSYRDFIGRHRMLRSRGRVRIKAYTLDPLMPGAERQRVVARTVRDMEALQVLAGTPYVAKAYDVIQDVEDELLIYMVSEWVGAETLASFIAQGGGLEGAERWRYMAELCRAVSALHRAGIVHRGLHPGGIFLQPEGAEVGVKVADFDFARINTLDSIGGELSSLGRDGYVAPELLEPSGVHDGRVDIFSVGAIFYELLTGEPLYEDVTWVLGHEARWPLQRARIHDPELRELLDSLLAARPEQRATSLEAACQLCEAMLERERERC